MRTNRGTSHADHARGFVALILTVAASALVGGCSVSPARDAFQAYYDATQADLRSYYAADQTLSDDQRARRVRAVDAAGAYLYGDAAAGGGS